MINLIKTNWNEIINYIVSEHGILSISKRTWLDPLSAVSLTKNTNNELILNIAYDKTKISNDNSSYDTDDSFIIDLLNSKFKNLFATSLDSLFFIKANINFEILNLSKEKENTNTIITNIKQEVSIDILKNSNIDPRYKFENFVLGSNNQMAHATAMAIANSLGDIYNPFFLYSGPGLGKTHLMHSVANYVLEKDPTKKVLYVTCEQFTNAVIKSIREKSTDEFRKKYRNLDLLLIDDIQFLLGKDSTQTEFFNTFNDLYGAQKQIIISSDRTPRDFSKASHDSLPTRITSRFMEGVIQDITAPDYETRMAILEKKEEEEHIKIDREVLQYIATNITTNIRELEGALNKITAMSRLNNTEVNIDIAMNVLKDFINPNEKKVLNVDYIIQIVAEHFSISKEDIIGKKRDQKIAYPRHIAIYLIRNTLDTTLQNIGKHLGGRDHSTILNSISAIDKEISSNNIDVISNIDIIKKKLSPQ